MAKLIKTTDIAPAWAGHYCGAPVLCIYGDTILAAFYDEELRLAAAISRGGGEFEIYRTDIRSDWNTGSHHAITLGADESGRVHICAAMHAEPLKYLRSGAGFDLSALRRIDVMTGSDEERVTYPQFFRNVSGRLCFTYRSGESGNGDQHINVWNNDACLWERLPRLTDGSVFPGGASAYFQRSRPVSCPDGYMRAEFMWRADARAETCFDLCCIRSRDMVNWETESGTPLTLPVTPYTEAVAADRIPQRRGLTNMCHALGADEQNRPVITYHKYTPDGKSGIYNARPTDGGWQTELAYTLDTRWDFSGVGAIPHLLDITPVRAKDGALLFNMLYSGKWIEIELDPVTLVPVRQSDAPLPWEDCDGDIVTDRLKCLTETPGRSYFLRWEHGENNRDQKPDYPPHAPRMLKLLEYDGDVCWLREAH